MISCKSEEILRKACEGTLYEYVPSSISKNLFYDFDFATGRTSLFIYLRKKVTGLEVFKHGPIKNLIQFMEDTPEMMWDLTIHPTRDGQMRIGKRACTRIHKHRKADIFDILVAADFQSQKKSPSNPFSPKSGKSYLPDPDQLQEAEEKLVEKALECLDYEKRMGRANRCDMQPFDPEILERTMGAMDEFFEDLAQESTQS